MNKVSKWVLAASIAIGSLAQQTVVQANPTKDFYKIDMSRSEYSNVTSSGKTVHCVFLNFRNLDNQERYLTSDEQTALRSIQLVDRQNYAYAGQLISRENEEFPNNHCFKRNVLIGGDALHPPEERTDITPCLGITSIERNQHGCYLLRFDTPMGIRASHLQLAPLTGQPITIRL
jgi:hypothetical protein